MPGMAFAAKHTETEASICIAQAEYLHAFGGIARNTFIEFPLKAVSSQRRSRSSPPSSCSSDDVDALSNQCLISCGQASSSDVSSHTSTILPKRPRWSDADDESVGCPGSPASTVCSDSEHQRISDVHRSVACIRAAEDLAALVKECCGFLRIRSHALQMESKVGRRSSVATIRFFTQGLPCLQEAARSGAKWVQPLLWSITAMLARSGVKDTVKGGDLMVCLASGLVVRVDFAAARM